MLFQVATPTVSEALLNPVKLYRRWPEIMDIFFYWLLFGMLLKWFAYIPLSKTWGEQKADKFSKSFGAIGGLIVAFVLRVQGVSLVGFADSGWFYFLVAALIAAYAGMIAYGKTQDYTKALLWGGVTFAVVFVMLLGAGAAGVVGSAAGVLIWGVLLTIFYFMLTRTPGVAPTPAAAPGAAPAAPAQAAPPAAPAAPAAPAQAAQAVQGVANNAITTGEQVRSAIQAAQGRRGLP